MTEAPVLPSLPLSPPPATPIFLFSYWEGQRLISEICLKYHYEAVLGSDNIEG